MAKVRADLVGVIITRDSAGTVILSAGDDIPEGVTLGPEDIAAEQVKRTRRKTVTADESDHDGDDSKP